MVRDEATAIAFYARVLGMEMITFGQDRKAVRFWAQKINFHLQNCAIVPHAHRPTPGSAESMLHDLNATALDVIQHLQRCGVAILAGPIPRTGAQGPIRSVYYRDPDLNLIEVSKPVNL
ncbi:MAG: VOC family protein [Leptolyngbyaceae cyanobacterium T60_A2020_046]|nr:VOC family protein [Leptolyngbyaceae cyanobacterium T60_A2020_046]